MKLSRPVSWFLLAFGVWSWFIWITFVKNLCKDGSGLAFDDAGAPTAYFWVHLLLAVTSFLLGTAIGVIGLRGVRALRRDPANGTPDATAPAIPSSPSSSSSSSSAS
ncbi:SCO4848 family membrane protein [Streptomyces celluloflavus]|uniref:SCO4848 family membrane protein n=2 Tax=Streptomyces TaxID=1883 RepID=A0ABW7R496_9ACTN